MHICVCVYVYVLLQMTSLVGAIKLIVCPNLNHRTLVRFIEALQYFD